MFLFFKYETIEKTGKKPQPKPDLIFPLSLFLSQKKDTSTGNTFSRNKNAFEQSESKEAKKLFQNNLKEKLKRKYSLWQG